MIIFTGSGCIAEKFNAEFESHIYSFRNLTDLQIKAILSRCTVLVHNAANLHPENLEESIDDNFQLTKRIIGLVKQVNSNIKFIYLSSMSILKDENQYKDFREMTYYGFGKYLGEIYSIRSQIVNCIIIRFSTIFYGDYKRDGLSGIIAQAIRSKEIKLINGGAAKRDFIPVEVACQYLHKICCKVTGHETFNIASGKSITFKDAALFISQNVNSVKISSSDLSGIIEPVNNFSISKLKLIGEINYDLNEFILKYLAKLQVLTDE